MTLSLQPSLIVIVSLFSTVFLNTMLLFSINTVVTVAFSKDTYRAVEGLHDFAEVAIAETSYHSITLANPVTFRVTPLTVQQALDRGIIDTYRTPDDENVSPSRASEYAKNVTTLRTCLQATGDN